jgi:predicted nucleic acid-binding protein
MTGFLLDTNVVSEAVSVRPSARVEAWMKSVPETSLYLSVLTIGELRKGIDSLPTSRRREKLESWVGVIKLRFDGRILELDLPASEKWGSMVAAGFRLGRPLPIMDGLIAATALEHGLTLVTRNVRDFARLGVDVFNPWESA